MIMLNLAEKCPTDVFTNVVIIGLGKQGEGEYLPNLTGHAILNLVAVCDNDRNTLDRVSRQYNVPGFEDVESMLDSVEIHLAIVSVPHNQYARIIKILAAKNIHIFKEKPVACSLAEFKELRQILSGSDSKLGVAVERRYDPLYQEFEEYIREVGQIHLIESYYTLSAKQISGWRSDHSVTGGGVLLDMGYHIVDLLIWYFRKPTKVKASMNGLGFDKINQGLETNALIQFTVEQNGGQQLGNTIGNLTLSSVFHEKQERLSVLGSKGHALLQGPTIYLYDNQGQLVRSLGRNATSRSNSRVWLQVEDFVRFIQGEIRDCPTNYLNQLPHIQFITESYESALVSGPVYLEEGQF